jgi:phosphoglycolate phosphatase
VGLPGSLKITLACLDLAGTTVADRGAVETAFAEALGTLGIARGTAGFDRAMAVIGESRGQPKIDVFRQVFAGDEALAQTAALSFERSYGSVIDRVGLEPMPGAEAVLDKLAGAGVRICLTTGFSATTMARVLDTLGWWRRVDLTVGPDDVAGRGSPHPDLVWAAALRLGVEDVRHIAVCGDTAAGMACGRRAGAGTVAGVLTGAHDRTRLLAAGATHVLDSIAGLPELLLASGVALAGI